ncbi:MAG: RodZ domain-containing protein [Paraperlucidibaca sp.]
MSTADESKQTPDVSEVLATDALIPAAPRAATTTPGVKLREARERKGMSLEQVVKETLLTSRYLKALEADDYDTLPGTTFVRGYLRRYAGVVGLSANELVAEFDAIWHARNLAATPLIDAQVHALQQEPVSSRRGNRRANMFTRTARQFSVAKFLSFGSVLLLLTLLVASLFWNDSTPVAPMSADPSDLALIPEPAPAIEEPLMLAPVGAAPEVSAGVAVSTTTGVTDRTTVVAPAASDAAVQPPVAPSAPAASGTSPAPVAEPAPPAAVVAAPAAVVAPAPAATTPAPPRIDTLSFTFTGKSWISVRDATGQELVYGLKNTGQSVTVTGQPPFAINIGSVRDTQMSRNGTPINLKPYTRGEIASFRLGR